MGWSVEDARDTHIYIHTYRAINMQSHTPMHPYDVSYMEITK